MQGDHALKTKIRPATIIDNSIVFVYDVVVTFRRHKYSVNVVFEAATLRADIDIVI